jgi:hypothetical protein
MPIAIHTRWLSLGRGRGNHSLGCAMPTVIDFELVPNRVRGTLLLAYYAAPLKPSGPEKGALGPLS